MPAQTEPLERAALGSGGLGVPRAASRRSHACCREAEAPTAGARAEAGRAGVVSPERGPSDAGVMRPERGPGRAEAGRAGVVNPERGPSDAGVARPERGTG
eukprot:14232210-Alexandrium_andersonii.AAC.1